MSLAKSSAQSTIRITGFNSGLFKRNPRRYSNDLRLKAVILREIAWFKTSFYKGDNRFTVSDLAQRKQWRKWLFYGLKRAKTSKITVLNIWKLYLHFIYIKQDVYFNYTFTLNCTFTLKCTFTLNCTCTLNSMFTLFTLSCILPLFTLNCMFTLNSMLPLFTLNSMFTLFTFFTLFTTIFNYFVYFKLYVYFVYFKVLWYPRAHFFSNWFEQLAFCGMLLLSVREIVWHKFWQKWLLWQPRHTHITVVAPTAVTLGSMFHTSISVTWT